MDRCRSCGAELTLEALRCATCGAPRGAGGVVIAGGLDRALEESMARTLTHGLLDREESLNSLMRDLDADAGGPLGLSELERALDRVKDEEAPSLAEMENLLAPIAPGNSAMLEGIALGELLDSEAQHKEILKKGMLFLKHRRYGNALEWWALQRQRIDPTKARFELLLMMMEAYTHTLAGDRQRAVEARTRVHAHPLYKKYAKPVR